MPIFYSINVTKHVMARMGVMSDVYPYRHIYHVLIRMVSYFIPFILEIQEAFSNRRNVTAATEK